MFDAFERRRASFKRDAEAGSRAAEKRTICIDILWLFHVYRGEFRHEKATENFDMKRQLNFKRFIRKIAATILVIAACTAFTMPNSINGTNMGGFVLTQYANVQAASEIHASGTQMGPFVYSSISARDSGTSWVSNNTSPFADSPYHVTTQGNYASFITYGP